MGSAGKVPAMATLRHQWILRKRRRPEATQFKGCPLPRHKLGAVEQNAGITMAYFHPWTLRREWGDMHVPNADKLKGAHETWKEALANCLDGNIICAESQRWGTSSFSKKLKLDRAPEEAWRLES